MIIFSYNFPHRKTEDFILYCFFNNIRIDAVIACDWKKLNVSSPSFKTKVAVKPKFEPSELCKSLKINYYNFNHDSNECYNFLKKIKPKLGLISGARIIPGKIIELFEIGIINFHPGDIPTIRGLNSSLRAIKLNHPQIITAHLIDNKIDSGTILLKKRIELHNSDTIFDINEKLYFEQISMIKKSIDYAKGGKGEKIKIDTKYHMECPFDDKESFEKYFKKYNK